MKMQQPHWLRSSSRRVSSRPAWSSAETSQTLIPGHGTVRHDKSTVAWMWVGELAEHTDILVYHITRSTPVTSRCGRG